MYPLAVPSAKSILHKVKLSMRKRTHVSAADTASGSCRCDSTAQLVDPLPN
jgi:hypothetical protein